MQPCSGSVADKMEKVLYQKILDVMQKEMENVMEKLKNTTIFISVAWQ